MLTTGIFMGLLATALMDLWALALHRFAGQPAPDWTLPGRWVSHMPGRIFHDDIVKAAPKNGELTTGWVFHYVVGAIYGVALAVIMGPDWLASPGFIAAWIFSLLTIGFGWFLMQPGMGMGFAASATPRPWKTRAMGLLAHTVFGAGLWLGAVIAG